MFPIVDLFAGPGGLGEGFSSCGDDDPAFGIVVSAEKDETAHKTLRLRAFFRLCRRRGKVPETYYDYVAGVSKQPYDSDTKALWEKAEHEARNLTLGSPSGNAALGRSLDEGLPKNKPWVLIGGPPCQAYSLVGRSRNAGKDGYNAELDKRHFLYRQYLQILDERRPSAFVMENVKGLLSSKVGNTRVFHQMLKDLAGPGGSKRQSGQYVIHSLVEPISYKAGDDPDKLDPHSYVIRCENLGVPQRRHRVILLGIRSDIDPGEIPRIRKSAIHPTVSDAIGALPPLRSGLSAKDSTAAWKAAVERQVKKVSASLKGSDHAAEIVRRLSAVAEGKLPYESRGGQCIPKSEAPESNYASSLSDAKVKGVLNHSSRGHMEEDLGRYLFVAAFGRAQERSPDTSEFPRELAADHENWESGNFADRFRVQLEKESATTITSHISKDGHYYIHPDPQQCRSFTVREAARIQSFPDNYFFEGPRTEQYVQTGNAVPPVVARQIAAAVKKILAG